MEFIDNVNILLKNELKRDIKPKSIVNVAAAYFSIYAFQELKEELEGVDKLNFLFTSPTFIKDKVPKEKREFFIPRLGRERNLYGSEFEIKLRNELSQKAIARECAEWISKKVTFKSNVSSDSIQGFITVDNEAFYPIHGFSTVELGTEKGQDVYTYISKLNAPESSRFLNIFKSLWNDKEKLQDVTEEVLTNLTTTYAENSPEFIYYITLYNIFNEFLEDVSEDVLPNEATGFKNSKIWNKLYNFQKDASLAIINKLEKYNGCILADSVGLGKTFTALSVIKYYEERNKSVLVLCPKKLADNWTSYKANYKNNPVAEDRLRYDVLFHTDLNRKKGYSNSLDLARINWGNYDLVVIDESHNFRNGGKLDTTGEEDKFNRYQVLMQKVIKAGVKTKVLMLSATPVNNKFTDLKNQLQLAYEGDSSQINSKLNTSRPIEDIFKNAQSVFNTWSKYPVEERTTQNLLSMLDFDFFEVLDSVTIARSRKNIEKYYDTNAIGKFPTRLPPISYSPKLTELDSAITYNEIFDVLIRLDLTIYTPTRYILPSKASKYSDIYDVNAVNKSFTQANREQGIKRLMAINLLKRMESSVHSFDLTLKRVRNQIASTIDAIKKYEESKTQVEVKLNDISSIDEMDDESSEVDDIFTIGKKIQINIADMDYISWERSLKNDLDNLDLLISMVDDITPEYDEKLQTLIKVIEDKIEHPINENNKKIIIFSAFADTADYIYENVGSYIKDKYNLNTALVSGTSNGKTTIPKFSPDFNSILTCFSPISKSRDSVEELRGKDIDILIGTDCISEGQNLQDCDYLINYDIHWNPVRIIQRFGRIDRIGSQNDKIQLVNFWPDISLDEYINLKAKVETKMKIVDLSAAGGDDLLSREEKTDLEYRKEQLKKLKEEVVDIEDMSSGISIMDLGLNEFRLDLLEYIKQEHNLDNIPFGLSAVTASTEDCPEGVIYVLKNLNSGMNINKQNRLHPFYLVYVDMEGDIVCNHLEIKALLDKFRYLCKGKSEPLPSLYRPFNKETRDGKKMDKFSTLLGKAINSIIDVKEESDMNSFLSGEDFSFFDTKITGLDDFELISFLVIRKEDK